MGSNIHFVIFFFLRPIYYLRTTLALLPSSNSIRSHIAGLLPPPNSARTCLHFLSREEVSIYFVPSSIRVELYLPTLLVDPFFLLHFFRK